MNQPGTAPNHALYRRMGKRILDMTVAVVLLVLLLPILLLVALSIRLALGSPVLFLQERAGMGGKGAGKGTQVRQGCPVCGTIGG